MAGKEKKRRKKRRKNGKEKQSFACDYRASVLLQKLIFFMKKNISSLGGRGTSQDFFSRDVFSYDLLAL